LSNFSPSLYQLAVSDCVSATVIIRQMMVILISCNRRPATETDDTNSSLIQVVNSAAFRHLPALASSGPFAAVTRLVRYLSFKLLNL